MDTVWRHVGPKSFISRHAAFPFEVLLYLAFFSNANKFRVGFDYLQGSDAVITKWSETPAETTMVCE